MNARTLHRATILIGAAAIAMTLGGCMGLSKDTGSTVASAPLPPVSNLGPAELEARAGQQGQAYKKYPGDAANAYAYAQTLGAMERHEQQAAVLERIVMTSGGDADTMAAYGKSLIATGEYARADQVLSQAFMPDVPDWRILSARGVANDKLGNHREARDLYEHALRIQPNEPSILTNLGLSHAFDRDYGQAEVYLRRATAQPGADPRAQQNLAIVLGLQGNREGEKATLAKVANSSDATDAMAAIKSLKSSQENTPRSAPLKSRPRSKTSGKIAQAK